MSNTKTTSKPSPAVTGIAAGAVAGAVQGSQASADPAAEHAYWQQHFRELPSVPASAPYEQYAPAFQYGWENRSGSCTTPAEEGPSFAAVESSLRDRWHQQPAAADLSWDMARDAVRAAWERVEQAIGAGEPKPSAK
jgi:hypothetical protein